MLERPNGARKEML